MIEHGRRIRACLKQPEFAPVSVPAQIAMLLALTASLFDRVPLDRMTETPRPRTPRGGERLATQTNWRCGRGFEITADT